MDDSFANLQDIVVDHLLEDSVSEVVTEDGDMAVDEDAVGRSALHDESSCTKQTRVTIKSLSPFTHDFEERLPDIHTSESASADLENNECYSPVCFKALKAFIHLWPLWSSVLQGQVGHFQQPQEHINALPCHSNAAVETYFKSIKHARMGHTTDFVLRQLEHVLGKTKELSLPLTMPQLKKMKGTSSDHP